MCVNWLKLIGNAGVAFFSTLSGMLSYEAVVSSGLDIKMMIGVSIFVASIQAGLAFFKELSREAANNNIAVKRKNLSKRMYLKLDLITFW